MLRGHKQVTIPNGELETGLAATNLPGEVVAYVNSTPEELERRYDVTFQRSFDNLDNLDVALITTDNQRFALVHHDGMPDDETEVYVDREAWRERDLVDDLLRVLGLSSSELAWRRQWPFDTGGARVARRRIQTKA